MAKYNVKKEPMVKPTITHQGGAGLTQKPEFELIGMLSTGIQNTFYEKEDERATRLKNIIDKIAKKDKLFVAKALVYARSVFGQRTVTHLGAVDLLPHLAGEEFAKRFFSKRNRKGNNGGVIWRLDDMAEILACYMAVNKIKPGDKWTMPRAMKLGFKAAIEDADTYELAKYQMKSNTVGLVDIVNLVHPDESYKNGVIDVTQEEYDKAVKGTKYEVGNEKYRPEFAPIVDGNRGGVLVISALRALVLGLLKQFNTVEDKNTEAGKVVAEKVKSGEISKEQAAVELNEAKTENFKELIETKKIGYFALIRNLRNILKTSDTQLLDKACDLLVQKEFIRKSLIWPHQIDLALEIMTLEFSGPSMAKVTNALNTAYELSIPNLENLLPEGKTAVVFDTSGSMSSTWKPIMLDKKTSINKLPAEKAALVAATFAKGVYGDVYHFANACEKIVGWNPNDSINTLKQKFMSYSGKQGHGTEFGSCFNLFERTNTKYDRILIISDEQDGYGNVERAYKSYCQKFGTPYVYIINVCGYEATAPIKNGEKVFRLYGYSSDIYEKIPQLELNMNVVLDAIKNIVI